MSAADMALVRDNVPGGFNLAVGEPYFLQSVYGKFYPRMVYGKMTYPLISGEPDLLNLVKARFSGQHVVITNGAKQALLAALYALKKSDGLSHVLHQAPYWPTYPTLADLSGMRFSAVSNQPALEARGVFARIMTAPNNPDGSMEFYGHEWDIWDAAYASPIYGWDGVVPWHRISVWSAAKLFGPSGYRIGWLATGDAKLAQLASEYVEKTTSGVSLPSQRLMYGLLFNLNTLSHEDRREYESQAHLMLQETSRIFMRLSHHFHEVKGFPATKRGMFAWVRAQDSLAFARRLHNANVKVVSGLFCGGDEDWFRISLGVLPETMEAAVNAIQGAERG